MSRRHRAKIRTLLPDQRYNSVLITKFINLVMKGGKKSTARGIVYSASARAERELNISGLDVFVEALNNVSPNVELRSHRIGGVNYQIPTPIKWARSLAIGMRWVLADARKRGGALADSLYYAVVDAYRKTGAAVKRCEDNYKMAEANKAFVHFRFFGNKNR